MGPEISARALRKPLFRLFSLCFIWLTRLTQIEPNQPDQTRETRSDQINRRGRGWSRFIGLIERGFDFVVDDRASCLAETREDSFHNHLVAFPNFDLTETDDFQRAGLILQEKPIGRLTLPIRRELDVGDLAAYHHFLAVVLLGMGEELGDLQKTGCVNKQRYRDEGEHGE